MAQHDIRGELRILIALRTFAPPVSADSARNPFLLAPTDIWPGLGEPATLLGERKAKTRHATANAADSLDDKAKWLRLRYVSVKFEPVVTTGYKVQFDTKQPKSPANSALSALSERLEQFPIEQDGPP